MKTKGCIFIILFIMWTVLIRVVDVQAIGVNGTNIGFATLNCWFHKVTGVHMTLYVITDWLGLVPVFVCIIFGGMGLVQLVQRNSFFKVDRDIIILGIYYIIVIAGYLVFEMIPVNYRPILIQGRMEASYPSSTTLLVLAVMPTLAEQVNRRMKNGVLKKIINIFAVVFSIFMVVGRLISGVHWFTDIIGGIILSMGLFCFYKAVIVLCCKEKAEDLHKKNWRRTCMYQEPRFQSGNRGEDIQVLIR